MNEARGIVARTVSERSFQNTVLALARRLGWRCYHTFNSRRSEAGFPDLVLVRDGRIIAAELKTEAGTLSKAQLAWLEDLEECPGVETHVWRPLNMRQVEETLRARRVSRSVSTDASDAVSPAETEHVSPDSRTGGPVPRRGIPWP